jgi:cystathionine beta-synthase
MKVYRTVEVAGRTPMLELRLIDTGALPAVPGLRTAESGRLVKDRIGLSMTEEAERRGAPEISGGTIIEATAATRGGTR